LSESRSSGRKPVVVDLFSGPGGLSLGFQNAGFILGVGVELDSDAAQTYRTNFPHAKVIERNIQAVTGEAILEALDRAYPDRERTIVVGGSPCQPFSGANMQRKGTDHPSASAVDHYWRLVKEVAPDAFLFENVVAFQTMGGGTSFLSLLEAVRELGFLASVSKLNAHDFETPQHRRRLFIGAVKGATGFVLPNEHSPKVVTTSVLGNGVPIVSVKDAISDLPKLPRGGGGKDTNDYPEPNGKPLSSYQKASREGSSGLFNHWSSRHSKPVRETIRFIKPGFSLANSWTNLPDTVKARYENKESVQSNVYRRLSWGSPSPTIVHPRRAMLLHPRQNRILSVREAARLQGFPDWFQFRGFLNSQYQQVANAVPPRLAEFLGRHYRQHLLQNS
jgi:DNA (cytosine-5)-methyltransferase 1